jgi:hypothetical protein
MTGVYLFGGVGYLRGNRIGGRLDKQLTPDGFTEFFPGVEVLIQPGLKSRIASPGLEGIGEDGVNLLIKDGPAHGGCRLSGHPFFDHGLQDEPPVIPKRIQIAVGVAVGAGAITDCQSLQEQAASNGIPNRMDRNVFCRVIG